MTAKVKKLVLSSSILAIAILLVYFQLPFLTDWLAIDFSLIAILIGRRYIGYWMSMLLMIIYPWFSILSSLGTPPGALFLMLQGFGVITIDYICNKKGYGWIGVSLSIMLITIWSILLNVFLIGPIWDYLGLATGDQFVYLQSWKAWLSVSVVFNPIKFVIVYAITWPIWIGLENSVNQEPNY